MGKKAIKRFCHSYSPSNTSQPNLTLLDPINYLINNKYYNMNLNPYFFKFWAFIIPATDLIVPSEHLHRHHTDGESHRSHNDFPWMRSHKKAMHSKESGQHFQDCFSIVSKPATMTKKYFT